MAMSPSAVRAWLDANDGFSFGWLAAAFVAALVAVFSRLPGALLHPQFFAEDGWVWYQQAYNIHGLRSLWIPQAGYLQTLSRCVAAASLFVPMQWAPLVMNLAGAAVQVLPVVALLSRRCTPWGSLPLRLLMAALYLAIPNAPEVHVVLTNAMWHLAVLQALLAFSVPPLRWSGRLADLLVFGVGCISGPYSILLLPGMVLWWWMRRQRWTLVVLGITSLGALLQLWTLGHAIRAAGATLGPTRLRLLRIVAGNIFVNSMVGSGGGYLGLPWLLLAALGGGLILLCAWRWSPLALRLYGVFAVLALTASLRDPLLLGNTMPRWEVLSQVAGIRYWFLPSLFFLWSGAVCAMGGKSKWVRSAGVSVLLLTVIGIARKWVYPPWPESHYPADVARFQSLRPGERMSFAVYDPGNRRMELTKR